jgi:hypothetical protein
VFYAGGGGGNCNIGTPAYGNAGGGDSSGGRGFDGVANTGGGGGGGGSGTTGNGGAGGSGIVIIRYPATASPPTSTTGNPQVSYAGGYQIYTWTSSGSVTF